MRHLLVFACVFLTACGAYEEAITSQGVYVNDFSGDFPVSEVDAAIALTMELAPAKYREAFAKLDGYWLEVLKEKRVEACENPKTPRVAGCTIVESSMILLANKTCQSHRTKEAVLAHEIGHALAKDSDPSHSNDDWYAAGGVVDSVQLKVCGWVPKPGETND